MLHIPWPGGMQFPISTNIRILIIIHTWIHTVFFIQFVKQPLICKGFQINIVCIILSFVIVAVLCIQCIFKILPEICNIIYLALGRPVHARNHKGQIPVTDKIGFRSVIILIIQFYNIAASHILRRLIQFIPGSLGVKSFIFPGRMGILPQFTFAVQLLGLCFQIL